MTTNTPADGALPLDGGSIGDVLTKTRLKGRVEGLDAALAVVAAVRKEYERQFGGHFLSSNEARRIFRLAMDAAERALKAAKRSAPASSRGTTSPGQ